MRLLGVSLCLVAVPLVLASSASASSWQKVAAQGEDDPDGRPYGSLILAPVIADDGSVSFTDVPSDPLPNPPRYSLWRWSEAGGVEPLATVVTSPSSAIGWRHPELFADAAGNLAWREGFPASSVDCGEGGVSIQGRDSLYELPREGEPALVAASGAAAPGRPDLTIARLITRRVSSPGSGFGRRAFAFLFPPPAFDPGGELTFAARVADDPCFVDSNDLPEAVFAPDSQGATTLVVREGDPVPGPGEATVHRLLDFARLVEPEPALLVLASADDADLDVVLLRWTSAGGLERRARTFESSSFTDGVALATIDALTSHASGAVAFLAVRANGDGETPDPEGLAVWTGDGDGAIERWPLSGPVPGAPEGAAFVPAAERDDTVADPLLVNPAGEVAFVAAFRPAPEEEPTLGLFAPGADGAPRLRFALGDVAPGLAGKRITWAVPLHLAGDGTLLAFVTAETEALDEDAAWYLLPPSAAPRLLLRASDPIEIAPGDVRSLSVRALAHDDALTRIAVRLGQSPFEPEAIAVRTVPEPCVSAAGACAFVAFGLLASRRRAGVPIRSGCRSSPRRGS